MVCVEMSYFVNPGPRSRRLLRFLKRRSGVARERRPRLDVAFLRELSGPRGIVFTDTADFTRRTARDGILHFLMIFERVARAAPAELRACGGRLVKVEADSMLLEFPDAARACAGAQTLERLLKRLSSGRPADERLRFSYGIGYGDVLSLEHDLFGLEVNLASKLGEDLAYPGEALLTPGAAAALRDTPLGRRLVKHKTVEYGGQPYEVRRLPMGRR
jgi:adenylate cyclase